jgi:AcrR family transcriptional regulator
MQQRGERRSNRERTEEMRGRLLAAARALFVERGYADTGTPEIVTTAGVTRGALYHHFTDKRALFRAVVETEAAAVAAEIEASSDGAGDAASRLLAGARAYLAAMAVPGRTRLLLVEAAAVLGDAEARTIDRGHAERTLREGLAEAMQAGALAPLPLEPLTSLLSAMFDRAALDATAGGRSEDTLQVIDALLAGIARTPPGHVAAG